MSEHTQKLKDSATAIMDKAYSPYSNFSVGAAILTTSGQIYTGCNVENVSFGLTICAERNAIAQAISAEGPDLKLEEVVITNRNADGQSIPCSPCGACRQVIAEFAHPETTILYQGKEGDVSATIEALLPDSFKF
ncbi:MAG: cytidine deaminase [Sneathiella sp.]